MLVKGDRLVVTEDVASFLRKGDIVEIVAVEGDIISFAFGEGFVHKGIMNQPECEAHFEKYVDPNKEKLEKIDKLLIGLENFKQTLLELIEELQPEREEYCPCDDCLYEGCDCCEDCEVYCDEDEEEDECLDTDLDCDNCDDYDCPYNRNVYNR